MSLHRFACQRRPQSMTLSRGKGRRRGGHHPEREEGKGTPGGEGIGEGSYVPRCCHSAVCRGVTGPGSFKGQHGLGVFTATKLLLSMAKIVGHSFSGSVKQAGSDWLTICTFGLCL